MRRPRVSISTFMVVVAIVAVVCALGRALQREVRPPDLHILASGTLPLAIVLVIGAFRLHGGRRRKDPYLMGFVWAGLLAMLGFVALWRFVPGLVAALSTAIRHPIVVHTLAELDRAGVNRNSDRIWYVLAAYHAITLPLTALAFGIPETLVAMAGGWAARRVAAGRGSPSPQNTSSPKGGESP